MPLSRTTQALLAVAAALILLLVLPGNHRHSQDQLPDLPAVEADAVTRIQIVRAGQSTVLEREGERWFLRQPLQAEADASTIRTLLRGFREPIPLDLRIDEGNLEAYGLDDSNNLSFEVFAGDSVPMLSMVLGVDLPGGSSVLRLPDSEQVFRARVGGRHRFDKDATEWRNRKLLDLEPEQAAGLTLQSRSHSLTFTREPTGETDEDGQQLLAGWQLADGPLFEVDQRTLEAMISSLARLRASELHAADFGSGWEAPPAQVELVELDGTMHRLSVVESPDGQAALARVEGRPDVYRVASTWLRRFQWPQVEFQDKTVFAFDRERVDSIVLEEGVHRVRIQQDLGTRAWRVVEPVSMEAELRKTLYTVNALSDLRAVRVSQGTEPAVAGLSAPRSRFIVEFIDGTSTMLEIGDAFQVPHSPEAVYARRDARGPIYELRADTFARLRQAFLKQ